MLNTLKTTGLQSAVYDARSDIRPIQDNQCLL